MLKKNAIGCIKSCLILMALLATFVVHAQSSTVTGKVLGASGEELLGVNVIVKGTRNGTTTGMDGSYTINVASPDAILVFSYLGFTTQELNLNGQSTLNVTMKEDLSFLDQVVVIGYR